MTDDGRPDRRAAAPRAAGRGPRQRGKLKIFFGFAPGVGKTYRMLEVARSCVGPGLDVVVGLVGDARPPRRRRW
ncbi:MAG: hypothetical protein IPG81_18925 [Sandaracinaceae bacterium]|nr:hypothetical protein [Sandaracinaceae bacterium]